MGLLIVDSIAFPFRMQQTTFKQQVVLLKTMGRLLRQIASMGVAVLLVNQVSGYVQRGHEAVKPALGVHVCQGCECVTLYQRFQRCRDVWLDVARCATMQVGAGQLVTLLPTFHVSSNAQERPGAVSPLIEL
jgi:hypothetical protein